MELGSYRTGYLDDVKAIVGSHNMPQLKQISYFKARP